MHLRFWILSWIRKVFDLLINFLLFLDNEGQAMAINIRIMRIHSISICNSGQCNYFAANDTRLDSLV